MRSVPPPGRRDHRLDVVPRRHRRLPACRRAVRGRARRPVAVRDPEVVGPQVLRDDRIDRLGRFLRQEVPAARARVRAPRTRSRRSAARRLDRMERVVLSPQDQGRELPRGHRPPRGPARPDTVQRARRTGRRPGPASGSLQGARYGTDVPLGDLALRPRRAEGPTARRARRRRASRARRARPGPRRSRPSATGRTRCCRSARAPRRRRAARRGAARRRPRSSARPAPTRSTSRASSSSPT